MLATLVVYRFMVSSYEKVVELYTPHSLVDFLSEKNWCKKDIVQGVINKMTG